MKKLKVIAFGGFISIVSIPYLSSVGITPDYLAQTGLALGFAGTAIADRLLADDEK